jgi:hypothetical protein
MKRLLASAVLVLSAAAASAQFEGEADFKIASNPGKGQSLAGTGRMLVTRSAYRAEWEMQMSGPAPRKPQSGPPPKMKMTMFAKVADPERLTMLNDESKTYSIWDASKNRDAGKTPKESYTVEKLGKETVAGLSCQNALLTSSRGNTIEVCVSRELAVSSDWLAAMNRREGGGASWIQALRDNGLEGFPIRLVMGGRNGAETTMTMELTRVERRSLPAELFEVPAGYKQTDFAMGGLSPEQEKAMSDARRKMNERMDAMSPEERKQYEETMKRFAVPTPKP